jgi:hypothetical protein
MATKKSEPKEKVYYIVNPAGAVHVVTREHARSRLRQVGYRMATKEEVAAYKKAKVQVHDQPIAEPWSPEPEPEPELE